MNFVNMRAASALFALDMGTMLDYSGITLWEMDSAAATINQRAAITLH
jgi:hypothetical protein